MKIISGRLDLRPLTLVELSLAGINYAGLEQTLGLNPSGTELDDEMLYAMQIRYSKVMKDPLNYPWLTNWAVIQREEQRLIGFIILKGCPNDQGEVILGYLIHESHRRQGYATEAVQCICDWIFSDPRALWVIADTEKDNTASHKVLEHLGAHKHREADELIWWRIARPAAPAPAESGVAGR
ncbi:GNAT family N-acetyltransferase [Paenibacillus sp. sgz5001063]|uniref:GNAT family N-acetyltransferase n=1 Tax=Paenibacillus sp. sgz5001063 TaxID=3242474 RepID=UPI0036D29D1A